MFEKLFSFVQENKNSLLLSLLSAIFILHFNLILEFIVSGEIAYDIVHAEIQRIQGTSDTSSNWDRALYFIKFFTLTLLLSLPSFVKFLIKLWSSFIEKSLSGFERFTGVAEKSTEAMSKLFEISNKLNRTHESFPELKDNRSQEADPKHDIKQTVENGT